MTETGVVKACVSCGKNLSGQQRMKDSQGRYWCMECGTEDQKRKLAANAGNVCSSCGETFPAHQLSVWGSKRLCPGCSPSNQKGPGVVEMIKGLFAGASAGGGDKKKTLLMFILMLILAAIAVWVNMS